MNEWIQHATGIFWLGQPGDVLWLATALAALQVLVLRAMKYIERMEPADGARLRLAWIAAVMPGTAFLALTPLMIHTFNFHAMGSLACMVHCYGLACLVIAVVGRAAVRAWWQTRGVARLMTLAGEPSSRLKQFGAQLSISVRQLQTDSSIFAVAGIWKPRVLVSQGALFRLTDDELRAALLHEKAHLRRHETLRFALAAFLNDCTPVRTRAGFDAYRKAREFAADREAVREAHPITLATVLLSFARLEIASRGIVQLAEAKNIKDRVAALLNPSQPTVDTSRPLALAAGFLAAGAMTVGLPLAIHALRIAQCASSH